MASLCQSIGPSPRRRRQRSGGRAIGCRAGGAIGCSFHERGGTDRSGGERSRIAAGDGHNRNTGVVVASVAVIATGVIVASGRIDQGHGSARMHPRIRVDATQLDDLVGLAGELVVVTDNLMGLREIPGVESWLHALESLRARQPGSPGHDP